MSSDPDKLRAPGHAPHEPADENEADDASGTSTSDEGSGSSESTSPSESDNEELPPAVQAIDDPSQKAVVADSVPEQSRSAVTASADAVEDGSHRVEAASPAADAESDGDGSDATSISSHSNRTGVDGPARDGQVTADNKEKEIDTDQAVRQLNAMFGSDSESDGGSVERRRRRNQVEGQQLHHEADSEAVQTAPETGSKTGATLGDLFGSDAEDESGESEVGGVKRKSNAAAEGAEVRPSSPAPSSAPSESLNIRRMRDVEDADDDEISRAVAEVQQPPQPEQQLVEVNIPFLDPELNQDDLVLLRNPKFFQIDSRPFTEEFYADGFVDADENADQKSLLDPVQIGLIKKHVENTVRWQENLSIDEDGNVIHLDESSNARIVEWSDGSYSLHVGDKYVGELSERPIDEHVHLFVEMSGQLHGTAVLKKKFLGKSDEVVSRGSGRGDIILTSSSALVAQKLARETKRVEYVGTTGKNPELLRADLWKKEEEKQKAATKRESAQRRVRERAHMRGISAKYLEGGAAGVAEGGAGEDEDENTISLSKIKREANVRSRQLGRGAYDDESEGEFDDFIAKGNEADDDDDDDDFGSSRKRKKERSSRLGETSSAPLHGGSGGVKKNPLADE